MTLNIHHQSNEIRFNNLDIKVQQSINKIQFIHQFLVVLDNESLEIHIHIHISQIDEVIVSLIQLSHSMSSFDQNISVIADSINISSAVSQYCIQS